MQSVFLRALSASVLPPLLIIASPASAQTAPSTVQFSFDGSVTQVGSDTFTVTDRVDNETLQFSRDNIPAYAYSVGQPFTATFTATMDPAILANSACGSRYSLSLTGAGACSVPAKVQIGSNSFALVGNGDGGDAAGSIRGLSLVADGQGGYSLDVDPNGYAMQYITLAPILFDSKSNSLSYTPTISCADSRTCPNENVTGTATTMSLGGIPISGDFGTYVPGINAGFNAGTAGRVSLSGAFSLPLFNGSSGNPTDVPAPPAWPLMIMGMAMVIAGRRRRIID